MIDFYFNLGPNPMKVALLLEELELPYRPIPIDMLKGEQHAPDYVAINPNAKVPAIVDNGVTVFDSNAILLYLAEKEGKFLSSDTPAGRSGLLSWLMFVATGVSPYSGQSVHFHHATPEPIPYAQNRYKREVERHYRVLDERLSHRRFLLGENYTIVDMALWGWARMLPRVLKDENAMDAFPHVKAHFEAVNARPAAQKAEKLRASHQWKTEMDAEARRHMFPSNEPA